MGEINEPYDDDMELYKENRKFMDFIVKVGTDELGIREYVCDGSNTTLYLHDPELYEQYDHFFRRLIGEELPEEYRDSDKILGGFITRQVLGEDVFETIAEAVMNSYNFSVVYRPIPLPGDVVAIDEQLQASLRRELDGMSWEDFQ
jgi:hypothetical protein